MYSGQHRFDLLPGTKPVMRPKKPLSVESNAHGIKVKIDAYGDAQADQLVTAAATKIAKSFGHSHVAVIDAIKAEITKDQVSTLEPAPTIHYELQLVTGRSQQSMAKAALVLWARLVGNDQVLSPRYDRIRNYMIDGDTQHGKHALTKLDGNSIDPSFAK